MDTYTPLQAATDIATILGKLEALPGHWWSRLVRLDLQDALAVIEVETQGDDDSWD